GAAGATGEVMTEMPNQLIAVCKLLDIPFEVHALFEALAWNDSLACTMARLLLWKDPQPLPAITDAEGRYQYYLRNWRPGAPDRTRWALRCAQSREALEL